MTLGGETRLHILLVDDDPVSRQVLERGLLNDPQLQARGIKTSRAGDGKRALAQIHKEMPDAVIVDLYMPRMDGFELARALRSDSETEHLPLVFVSGLADAAKVEAILAEVGGSFFPKPTEPDAVATALLQLLDEPKHPSSPQARAKMGIGAAAARRRQFRPGLRVRERAPAANGSFRNRRRESGSGPHGI